ncbi:MAG: hypothetical protein AB7P03_04780 [Kofleriaceae bacterium]
MRRSFTLAAGWIAAWSSMAHAGPSADAAAEFAKGSAAYQALRYGEAAERFEAAYRLDPDPSYLFNAAQAYRLARACAKAKAVFDQFLALTAESRHDDKVMLYVDDAAACAAEQERLLAAARVGDPRTGRTKRIAGVATAVTGVGLLATGTYLALRARSRSEDFDECVETPGCSRLQLLHDQGERADRWAKVSFAVGGAALLGGGLLYYLGVRDRAAESSRQVTVVPADGGLVVSYRGAL